MSTDRGRRTLSLKQRLDILHKLERGAPLDQIADDYGVATTTIRRIRQNAVKVRHLIAQDTSLDRKRLRGSKYEELDSRLYIWFLERRALGDAVTNARLHTKATEFMRELTGSSTLKASKGWIWRFKNRYGIQQPDGHVVERNDAERSPSERFIRDFNRQLEDEGINRDNIYNMDETGLAWKSLPRRVLMQSGEIRSKEDRLTVAFCANATGSHRLQPLFVYKRENPRALKHCKSLPVVFKAQRNARMDREIFTDWYINHFKTSVTRRQVEKGAYGKVILLVNDCRRYNLSELHTRDDQFEMLFLPSDVISRLQPLDQGIVDRIKLNFRHYMLKRILEFAGGVEDFYGDYDIKDCIDMLHESWMDVTSEAIKDSWRKILGQASVHVKQCVPMVNPVDLQELIKEIMKEDFAVDELTEWLESCAEVESEERERVERQGEGNKCADGNAKSASSDLDGEEIERSFRTIFAWARDKGDFVKFYVKLLKDFHDAQ